VTDMGFRILLIEDNPDNLELMMYLLDAFGYSTLMAKDGVEGLEIARREKPDLVICDIQMPRMDGYEVARAMQRDPKLTKIKRIAVTALAMVGDRDRILAAGFDGYISKPLAPRTFVSQVEQYLGPLSQLVRNEPPEVQKPAPAARKESTGPMILVVDDSPANRQLARDILEPSGYTVIDRVNAREALLEIRKNVPALILCDVHMKGGDGYECIREVRADPHLREIPIIFITSSLFQDEVRQKCLDLGAARCMLRPVHPEILLQEVRAVLRESSE
jgi:two-component system, cell cycle response regulator